MFVELEALTEQTCALYPFTRVVSCPSADFNFPRAHLELTAIEGAVI
jgi:hypothetical protein